MPYNDQPAVGPFPCSTCGIGVAARPGERCHECLLASSLANGDKVVQLPDLRSQRALEEQKAFLRGMLEQMETQADDVDRIAFAFMVRFRDGSMAVQASGFASDSEAQRYFEAVMRNRLGFS